MALVPKDGNWRVLEVDERRRHDVRENGSVDIGMIDEDYYQVLVQLHGVESILQIGFYPPSSLGWRRIYKLSGIEAEEELSLSCRS